MSGSPRLTSRNQLGSNFPITTAAADPTMSPAKESPKARSMRHVGPSFVYGKNFESFGGSVLQKAAMVVRSKPACENQGMSCRARIKGTYDDVRVFDAFSQRIFSFLPIFILTVASLPCQGEVRPSEGHETEDAADGQDDSLSERAGVVQRCWFSIENPVLVHRWDFIVLLGGGIGHGSTKHSSETSLVGEHGGPMIDPRCTREILYTCVTF